MEDIAFQGIFFSRLDHEIRLRLTNPNFFGVVVRQVPFRLELIRENGKTSEIARGTVGEVKIPRKGSVVVTIPISADHSGLLLTASDLPAHGGSALSVTGVATIDCLVTGWSFPFTRTVMVNPAMITGLVKKPGCWEHNVMGGPRGIRSFCRIFPSCLSACRRPRLPSEIHFHSTRLILLSSDSDSGPMAFTKGSYLKQLTAMMPMRSAELGRELAGSTPPSLFIGSWNYPNVLAGPMIAPLHGDTAIMDTPESWIPGAKTQEDILGYRLSLVRGKRQVDTADLNNPFVDSLQEIALAAGSIESEAAFASEPRGTSFSEEHTPFGPSAPIDRFEIQPGRWDRELEKVFYDTDLPAGDAILNLHRKALPFSAIQKALSAGTMGRGNARHLVPTRWSITACDSTIGDRLLARVRNYPLIDTVRVHEFASLNNRYAVILLPTGWQYEWTEAFLHVMGNEELVFSDHEGHRKKTGYSRVGGCYYSCKMAVLEGLERQQRQAGAVVLREAVQGYIPLGVFNVRENVRQAMLQKPVEFESVPAALAYLGGKFTLPVSRFMEAGTLLRDVSRIRQMTIRDFMRAEA